MYVNVFFFNPLLSGNMGHYLQRPTLRTRKQTTYPLEIKGWKMNVPFAMVPFLGTSDYFWEYVLGCP